jgi:hypothetical protein
MSTDRMGFNYRVAENGSAIGTAKSPMQQPEIP